MLFAENRLRKKKDFERVMKDKQSRGLSVSFLSGRFLGNGLAVSRIGFVVSKKVSKKAVQRNKVKRRLREAARFLFSQIKPGFDAVIFTRPEIAESDFSGIKQSLEALFKKAGLWKL
ncbi:MAG: ribonuclease P protein component [Candidatus Pacebacteria bacterium]|nr:ribonuclease P protein component [Candidatus Paceibacterota bacterium]